jgi:hypothetical protein
MDIFNLNLNPEDDGNKFNDLDKWFSFMNDQFKALDEENRKHKINNLLQENDINEIE